MPVGRTNRRAFIAALGGAAAWPLAARAQQVEQVHRIGVLMFTAANDPEASARVAAFQQGLRQLGRTDGHNIRIDIRWGAGDPQRFRKYAAELVALAPDVILAASSGAAAALQEATRNVPIVFVNVTDPVGAGYVASLTRAAVLRDPGLPVGIGQFASIQSMAPAFGVEVSPIDVRDANEIKRAVTAFARSSNGGLIVTASPVAIIHRELIITLAAQHKLPAVYFQRSFVAGGGLISYGPDPIDQYRRAAGYVDRILKGEKPGVPVQAPTKYELAINLKSAKALGLTVPPSLLARADEVIE